MPVPTTEERTDVRLLQQVHEAAARTPVQRLRVVQLTHDLLRHGVIPRQEALLQIVVILPRVAARAEATHHQEVVVHHVRTRRLQEVVALPREEAAVALRAEGLQEDHGKKLSLL